MGGVKFNSYAIDELIKNILTYEQRLIYHRVNMKYDELVLKFENSHEGFFAQVMLVQVDLVLFMQLVKD